MVSILNSGRNNIIKLLETYNLVRDKRNFIMRNILKILGSVLIRIGAFCNINENVNQLLAGVLHSAVPD